MQPKRISYVLCLLMALAPAMNARAETLYVTDKVLLPVTETADPASRLLKQIPTGTSLEVLQRDGEQAQVRIGDDLVGWVKSKYLVSDPPAQILLLNLVDKHNQVNDELKSVRGRMATLEADLQKKNAALSDAEAKINQLANDKDAAKGQASTQTQSCPDAPKVEVPANMSDSWEKIKVLTEENKLLTGQVKNALLVLNGGSLGDRVGQGFTAYMPLWFVLSLIIVSAIGFASGIFWLDYKHRQKHGGFRL